jgi:hypothetical protein
VFDCAAPGHICLQELLYAPGVSVYKSLCCTYGCPSTRAFVLNLAVSVFKSLSYICACLSTRDLFITERVCLQEPSPSCTCKCTYTVQCTVYIQSFGLVSASFEIYMFVSVVSINVQYTETNRFCLVS